MGPTFCSQNLGHKNCDPCHSSNIFRLDSLGPRTSTSLHRFIPVTGELHKIQKQYLHGSKKFIGIQEYYINGPKQYNWNGIINWHACGKQPKYTAPKYLSAMFYFFPLLISAGSFLIRYTYPNPLITLKNFCYLSFHSYLSLNPHGTLFYSSHSRRVTI